MLVSMKNFNFSYIGQTHSISKRIQAHNTGVGSVSTEPLHLRPYALFAYICGFNCRFDVLEYMETQWKVKRDRLIRSGVNDLKAWAYSANDVISELNVESVGIQPSELTLICLFND